MMTTPATTKASPAPAYWAFAAFGSFWGVWGAALPQIRDLAGVSDGQLGTALLFIAAGALPAMLVVGRASDRFGRRVPAGALMGLALMGVVVSLTARGPVSLWVGLAALGAASGAADVAINAVAGAAERACARPVITRSHAAFSAAVVISSLLTGLLHHFQVPMFVAFGLIVPVALIAASRLLARTDPAGLTSYPGTTRDPADRLRPADGPMSRSVGVLASRQRRMLIGVGAVAALAYAVENAHQSWGAVYLQDVLVVSPGLTAAAPALFAAVAALTRYAAGWISHLNPLLLLLAGGAAATAGTLTLAAANSVGMALLGLACTAAGTAVLFPTLLKASTANIEESLRGRVTSAVASTAYLGYLLGPAYVGHLADAFGLRTAMVGIAAVAAVFTLIAWPLTRATQRAA